MPSEISWDEMLKHDSRVTIACRMLFAAASIFLMLVTMPATAAQPAPLDSGVLLQIQALQEEKATRTPAQQKMDSQLIYAAKESRGEAIAAGAPNVRADVKFAPDGLVLVDVDAEVTPGLLAQIVRVGGEVVSQFPKFRAVRALLPVDQIEAVAALDVVKSIRRADEGQTNVGSVTSEGDLAHRGPAARSEFRADGTGVKVGVLSDSVDSTYLASLQSSDDLGALTILPGQAGSSLDSSEGSAMLEIVHDLAPGASLYFATAFGSDAAMAQNILDLRTAGCDIIVDDVTYYSESPFQDGIISRAVNTVVADGALYFSSAANSGNLTDGTSSTWEGDFADGGVAASPVSGKGGRVHTFGGGTNYNTMVKVNGVVNLFWSDPLGASTNDYDLYVLNSTGSSVVYSSTTTQNGTQDPYEQATAGSASNRIVIVKASGAPRFLHLANGRGQLKFATSGSTRGHNAAGNAFCVAAVSALTAYPSAFVGGSSNPLETFSSDGLRRMFFNPDGSEITPGNLLSSGGVVLQKPDFAAADGVVTATPGFDPFYGTSAAAPHAAAIAALVKSCAPWLTPAQIRTALTNSALDIMAAGTDRDSGVGIIMAWPAVSSVAFSPRLDHATYSDVNGGNGNGYLDPGETIAETVVLTNFPSRSTASGVSAVLSSTTPGVTMVQAASSYPNIAAGNTALNLTPFTYRLAHTVPGGTSLFFTCVQTANGSSATATFTHVVGRMMSGPTVTNTYMSSNVPKTIVDSSTIFSTNVISSGGDRYIDDVNVLVRLNHTWDADLIIALQNPAQEEVILASKRGNSGDNYGAGTTNTVFDDEAATAISAGSPPFLGSFRPEAVLSTFDGGLLDGAWRLRVTDSAAGDTGTLLNWGMQVVSHTAMSVVDPFYNEIIHIGPSSSSNLTVRWMAPTNGTQYLEVGTGVISSTWAAVATNVPPTALTNSATIPLGSGPRFYRVRSVR